MPTKHRAFGRFHGGPQAKHVPAQVLVSCTTAHDLANVDLTSFLRPRRGLFEKCIKENSARVEKKEIVIDLDCADRLSVGLTNLAESWCQLGAQYTPPNTTHTHAESYCIIAG